MTSSAELIPSLARSMSLWAIDEELQTLMEQAQLEEEETGSVSPDTITSLQAYFAAAVEKVDRIAGFLKLEKVLEPAYKAEMERLRNRWKAYENQFDRCKEMLLDFLRTRGETKIKGQTNTISRQANSQASLELEEFTERHCSRRIQSPRVDEKFQRLDVTISLEFWKQLARQYTVAPDSVIEVRRVIESMIDISQQPFVDTSAVKFALQAGEEVTGAALKFGEHIRVR